MAWFFPDGKLQQALLARDATIHRQTFKRGDVVLLRHDGTPAPKLELSGPRGRLPAWRR